jgi:hypothetical protein
MHNNYEEVIEDVRETSQLLKEQARLGWEIWVIMAFVAMLAFTTDVIGLLRAIFFLTVLGFYYAYKWHLELNRRLLLSHRLQMTLVKRALPVEDAA